VETRLGAECEAGCGAGCGNRVEQDVDVQGATSLKKVNRLRSSVWDLFERTKDGKTAKLVFNQRNVI